MEVPLLDFQCNECGEKFDELTTSSNRDKVKCPSCQSKNIKQIFEGKCYFGMAGSSAGSGGGCSAGSCSGCSGCH
jgi:putative FmdB family regulatory protein